jgi:hypothetical protein
MEINQQNPMAFTMGFHNDLPMMFGLTMAFTIDFPMMFQWKITQDHGFYHGLNMMEIFRLSAFCQCSGSPKSSQAQAEGWSEDVVSEIEDTENDSFFTG